MKYTEHNLLEWLKSHSAINLKELERLSNIPKGSIEQFKNERRSLPPKHFDSLENVLSDYGYQSLNNE